MKRILAPIVLAVLTGCANNPALTRSLTRVSVGTGVAVGVQRAPTAKPYLEAASTIVCALAYATNVSPQVVVDQLERTDIAALKTTEGILILNGALGLYVAAYEAYGGSVKNAPTLQSVLQGTCDGLHDGLGITTPTAARQRALARPHVK